MYNVKIKGDYLLTINGKSLKNITSFFKSCGEYESKLDKDVAQFSDQELANLFETLGSCNVSTIKSRVGYLKNYKFWYNDNIERCSVSLSVDNIIGLIDFQELHVKNLFYSIEEVISAVDRDMHTIGKPYAPMYILAWYGFDRRECYKIKKSDLSVGFDGKLHIQYEGRVVVIDNPRCIDILVEYANTTSYKKTQKAGKVHYEENDVYLIRKFSTTGNLSGEPKPQTDHIFTPLTAGYSESPKGKRITTNNIKLSGEMYRLYQAEKSGRSVEEFLAEENPNVNFNYVQSRKDILEIYKKYL